MRLFAYYISIKLNKSLFWSEIYWKILKFEAFFQVKFKLFHRFLLFGMSIFLKNSFSFAISLKTPNIIPLISSSWGKYRKMGFWRSFSVKSSLISDFSKWGMKGDSIENRGGGLESSCETKEALSPLIFCRRTEILFEFFWFWVSRKMLVFLPFLSLWKVL